MSDEEPHKLAENSAPEPAAFPDALSSKRAHQILIAVISTIVASVTGWWVGANIGGWGDKKSGHQLARRIAGVTLGVASGIIALDANLRAPETIPSLAGEAKERKRLRAEASEAAQAPAQKPSPVAATAVHEGVVQPQTAPAVQLS